MMNLCFVPGNVTRDLNKELMFSKISWSDYGAFMLLAVLVYYFVVVLLYFRQELNGLLLALFSGRLGKKNVGHGTAGSLVNQGKVSGLVVNTDDGHEEEQDLLGKPMADEGMESVSLEELDFGGNDKLLQGELADCLEELNYTVAMAGEKNWDRLKLQKSFTEIGECYAEVFNSELRFQVLEQVSALCSEKLDWQVSIAELENFFGQTGKIGGDAGLSATGKITSLIVALVAFFGQVVLAQDGGQGISEASGKIKGYFDLGTELMYAIGALMGLVGAIKVYSKWNSGEPDTAKVATAWFGACVFLVVVASVLKSFFGL